MPRTLEKEHGPGKVLHDWWRNLDNDRAGRAVLRRASSITDVSLSAPYQRLYRRLVEAGWKKPWRNDALAAAVGLLAHVTDEPPTPTSPASSMSVGAPDGDRAGVGELRFRRLLESSDVEALYAGLRRALPLCNHNIDVLSLANDVIEWGDKTRKSWAYSYNWPDK